jgi:hypothetical protein
MPVLTSAAMLVAEIEVSSERTGQPRCFPLTPFSTTRLLIGDSAEFVANGPPEFEPAQSIVVAVSSRPGPVQRGPGQPGGIPTSQVIIRLTAVQPGYVVVHWIDCSGTGC